MKVPSFLEDHISQVPALQLLQNMGYTYQRPAETFLERGGKTLKRDSGNYSRKNNCAALK